MYTNLKTLLAVLPLLVAPLVNARACARPQPSSNSTITATTSALVPFSSIGFVANVTSSSPSSSSSASSAISSSSSSSWVISSTVSSSTATAGSSSTESSSAAAETTTSPSSSSESVTSSSITETSSFTSASASASAAEASACGSPNDDSLSTVALYGVPYGTPLGAYNDGVNCGKTITIKRLDTGAIATANITNACPSCVNSNNIDLSDSLFKEKLGGTAELGIMKVEWSCPDCVF